MDFFSLSALINAFTSLVLGVLIIFQARDRTYITFSLFAFAITVWSIFYFLWQQASNPDSALLWTQWLMAAAAFIPFFYFHFITSFLGVERSQRLPIIAGYCFAVFFSTVSFTSLFIESVSQKLDFAFWPNPGPLYLPFLVVWLLYVLLGTWLLFRAYRTSQGQLHAQSRLILLGMVGGYLGGVTNYFLWFDIPIPPVGNILVSFYVIMVSYAILQYRLFNLKIIVTEIFVLALGGLSIGQAFFPQINFLQGLYGKSILTVAIIISGFIIIRGVLREVDQREEIEKLAKKLESANERLKELDQLKNEFLSIASHQLRAPITAIRGYASLILESEYGALPDFIKEPIQRIADSSRNMANSIEDYLNVSRIEQGRMKYEKSNFDLSDLAKKTAEEMRPVASRRGLELSVEAGEPVTVNADVGKIKQVLSNLIDNSIKYTEKGGVKVEVKKEGSKARLTVFDTGIGIPREEVSGLFEKFKRARGANKVNTTGTGLGLYVAKQLIDGHGGKIWVESDGPGKGSRFIVELPV